MHGSCIWFFPDGDLPPSGEVEPKGHESLVILNPNGEDAELSMSVYYEDRPAATVALGRVAAERVRCFRLDGPVGEPQYRIPFGQYALQITSTVPVICQIGRMDVRQANLAYYTVLGHPA
ncbi:MAG: hypothetical protein HQL31_03720 [Planctomycetes bacterium]|nr:hypothetical protein [Planctomycetota bacterium]